MIIGGGVKLVLLIHCRSRTGGGGQGGNVGGGGVRVEGKGGVGWSRGGGGTGVDQIQEAFVSEYVENMDQWDRGGGGGGSIWLA